MNGKDFSELVQIIAKKDLRYDKQAYFFVRQALDYTLKQSASAEATPRTRHVNGRQLSEGIRDFALDQFGPMTHTLFTEWGIHSTEDFGEIVYNLVEYKVFGTTDDDRREDFSGVFDFEEAFRKPFAAPSRERQTAVSAGRSDASTLATSHGHN